MSPLAVTVAQRGHLPLARVGGVLLHRAPGKEDDLVRLYGGAIVEYPHYLVGKAAIYSFCDEGLWAAHAAWRDTDNGNAELVAYQVGQWRKRWMDVLGGKKLIGDAPRPDFYAWWNARWQGRGLAYESPHMLVSQVAWGSPLSPNGVYIGIEACEGYAPVLLGALVRDVLARHGFATNVVPGSLPQAWCCTHSDVSPIRRTRADGTPFDPGDGFVDWPRLESAIRDGTGVA